MWCHPSISHRSLLQKGCSLLARLWRAQVGCVVSPACFKRRPAPQHVLGLVFRKLFPAASRECCFQWLPEASRPRVCGVTPPSHIGPSCKGGSLLARLWRGQVGRVVSPACFKRILRRNAYWASFITLPPAASRERCFQRLPVASRRGCVVSSLPTSPASTLLALGLSG